ncbi:MAG TPA: GtrA family protein [Candidatus Baltobacteraceae bacterium]|jgi:putative flippase GtrA|nr:GtrA family protein [Candidatus Baltobacteraceae bacterium]
MFASIAERRGVRQFVKFGIVGASGFLVNLIVFTLLQRIVPQHWRPLQYNIIYSVAFFGGGVSNYYFNRIWTFRSTGHAVREGAQFLTVSAIALVVGLIVSALVSPWLGHGHKTWFVATIAGIVINFFLNKYWTFKDVA